jgi:hypothetical protein
MPNELTAGIVWELILKLSDEELRKFWEPARAVLDVPVEFLEKAPKVKSFKLGRNRGAQFEKDTSLILVPNALMPLMKMTMNAFKRAFEAVKRARDAKRRNSDRNGEIIRLRDEEGKKFGEIGRLLLIKNSRWCGRDGKPLRRDTIERAYRLEKAFRLRNKSEFWE